MNYERSRRRKIELHNIGVAYRTERQDTMRIAINPEYVEGLDGIEELDHLEILYWMHKLNEEERAILKIHPRGDLSRPVKGVFSLRSPVRPNPIGVTRVRLLKREDGAVLVEGLDALDGSPVIDIKSG